MGGSDRTKNAGLFDILGLWKAGCHCIGAHHSASVTGVGGRDSGETAEYNCKISQVFVVVV